MTSVRRQRRVLVGLAACLLVATQVPRVLRGDAAEVERQHRLLRAQTAQVVRDDLQMSGPKCRSFIESSPEGPVGGPHRAIVPQGIELADASLSTSTKRELAADRPRTGSHRQPGVFMLPPNAPRIFFISFNPTFTDTSYLCAIESAAVTNPTHRVDVYTPNVTDLNNVFQTRWSRTPLLSRVFALPLSHAEMFEATPFELWHTNGTYNESTWPDQNLGNAFRLAVLWKAGGTYLDMDIVSVNPIPPASRALATQDEILLNNAVLSFPARDPMVWALMEEFVRNYNGRRWGYQGPWLITRTLAYQCPIFSSRLNLTTYRLSPAKLALAKDNAEVCSDLIIYNRSRFYAVPWKEWRALGEPWHQSCDLLDALDQRAIGLHLWHKLTLETTFDPNSVYMRILQRGCPFTQIRAEELHSVA